MKVVLDSNIISAAFSTHGLCNAVFELCLDRCDIHVSDFILNEVKSVFKEKYKIPDKEIQGILDYAGEYCFVTPYPKLTGRVCRDENDDEMLALARENRVHYIITGDQDLLTLKEYETIPIVTPREFWEKLKEKP